MSEKQTYVIRRKANRISLNDLAKYIGISASALSQYESGKSKISQENIKKYQDRIDELNQLPI
ncbi:helix-turn-helix domain-containing protein [Alkalihalobacillus sp. NPDC078783]|uniref:helix-turn-helix domain-containing protein n=1 Tax=Streptomyces albidoflavus TaxID=1886 RepID=UPI0033C8241D